MKVDEIMKNIRMYNVKLKKEILELPYILSIILRSMIILN